MLRVSGSTLVLVLDTVDALLGEGLDEATQRGLVEASLVTWRANTSDPQVEISIAALLETLVERVPDVTVACASQAAVEALGTAGDDAGLAASAAALMRTVLNTAPARALHDIDSFFAAAAAYLMRADDAEAVPSLLQCFTTLCQKRGDELLAWRDEQGTRALDVMLRVVERVLSLDESVWGMALGTLLVTLMVAAGAELHPILGALLEALAARLARAQTSSCILALLFPLAYLFAEYTDATIAQLSEMQLSGRCALEVVVAMWLREVTHVHGWFVQNVHVLGLTRLLDHWPMALEGVCVDGDALMEEDRASPRGPTDAGIITRSRARSRKYCEDILMQFATSRFRWLQSWCMCCCTSTSTRTRRRRMGRVCRWRMTMAMTRGRTTRRSRSAPCLATFLAAGASTTCTTGAWSATTRRMSICLAAAT